MGARVHDEVAGHMEANFDISSCCWVGVPREVGICVIGTAVMDIIARFG